MSNHAKPWWGFVFIWFMLAAVDVWAQSATAPGCETDAACVSLYDRAKEESSNGNLVEAQRLYKLAYEVRADPRLLFSIARILHKLERLDEAARYYQQFIGSPLQEPEQKQKAQEYLNQISQRPTAPPAPAGQTGPSTSNPQSAQPALLASGTAAAATTEPRKKPIYKKAWFWSVIGATVVVGVAVGLGVGLAPREPNTDGLKTIRPFDDLIQE